jgi:hypothetical protein
MATVFTSFIVVGAAMPVLPPHVHDGLGLSTLLVGLVAGSQFAASSDGSGPAAMPTWAQAQTLGGCAIRLPAGLEKAGNLA